MKVKALSLQINESLLLAFMLAVAAFVFASAALAAKPSKAAKAKKVNHAKIIQSKSSKSVMFEKMDEETQTKIVTPSVFTRARIAHKSTNKLSSEVMLGKTRKQRNLIAQADTSSLEAKKLDAKLEGEIAQDSIPIAASSESSLSTSVKEKSDKGPVKVGLGLSMTTAMSVTSEEKKSYAGTYGINPSISYEPSALSLSAEFEYNREYTYQLDDGTDGDWSSALIKFRKTIKTSGLVDTISIGPNLGIPMGNEAKRQTFRGSLGFAVGVSKTLGSFEVGQGFGYTARSYEYDIRDDGTVNSPSLYSSATSLSLALAKWLSVAAGFNYQYAVSYQNVGKSSTTTDLSLALAPLEQVSVVIGSVMANKGTLQADGQTNKVTLWDPGSLTSYLTLGLSF